MSAQPQALAPVTAAALLALGDDGRRWELVEGEWRALAPAGFEHGRVSMRVGSRLDAHVEKTGAGVVVAAETGFRIAADPDTVRGPDVAFVAGERLPPRDLQRRFLDLAPDLVVEVVSPGDRPTEVAKKVRAWLVAGCRLAWVVSGSSREVAAHTLDGMVVHLGEGDVLDGGDVLPGFRLPVADIFR